MEGIEVCDDANEDAEEIGSDCQFETTGSDTRVGLTTAEPGRTLQVKTINSLRFLSKDPDIIVVKERQFKCEVQSCGQKFLSGSSLLRHTKRYHSNSDPATAVESSSSSVAKGLSFTCPVCSKIFSQQGNLKAHLRTHSNDLPFACNFTGCRRCFSSTESLKRHKLTHLGIKLFDCDICGRSCSSNLALKEHVARHVDLKPYRCDTCGRMFRQVSCYKRHLQTHNNQHRPFECDICHQAFSQTVYLKSHMMSHTGEKPFECVQCRKRFAHASDRNRHMSVHSDERKFACGLCGARFTDPSSCRRHIHEHSSAKNDVCLVCDASFKRSFQLKHHIAKSHGIKANTIPAISVCQSLPAAAFSRNHSPAGFQDGAKKLHVIDLCPSGSLLIGGTKMAPGISRPVRSVTQLKLGISKSVQREAPQVMLGISRSVQRGAPQVTMGISKPGQKEVPQVTKGNSKPFVKEAAVGISRRILETVNDAMSWIVYPVEAQASETNHHHLEQEQKFSEDQKIISKLEDQIARAREPDSCFETTEGAETSDTAGIIANITPGQSNFSLRANLAESHNNFSCLTNFHDQGNLMEAVCSSLGDSGTRTHAIFSAINADNSKELSFTDKICCSKITSNAVTDPTVTREATESLPLHDTLSPVTERKNDAIELPSLCHEYSVDQNPEISAAIAPCKGFADMSLPYDDVLKMLSTNDSLDQLNCFENLQQHVCR